MAERDRNIFWEIIDHAWDIAATASLLSHAIAPIAKKIGLNIPEFDVDKEDGKIQRTSYNDTKDSTRDEAAWNILLSNTLSTEGVSRVTGWYATEFSYTRGDWKARQKALHYGQEFRIFVLDMDEPPSKIGEERTIERETVKGKKVEHVIKCVDIYGDPVKNAATFLKDFDRRIMRAYKRVTGETKTPPYHTWPEDVISDVCEIISIENFSRAIPHIPRSNEPHWTDHATTAINFTKSKAADTADWSKQKLDRATRVARAQNYLAYREERNRQYKLKTSRFARILDRIDRSL